MPKKGDRRIYLSPPNVGEEESGSLRDVIQSGWVAPVGPQLNVFEEELESKFPGKRVLALSSGTSALHLALILSGVSDGDEVLVGSFTFAAAVNVVHYERAIPVFLDSECDTWNIDPNLLSEYLKNHTAPKAVIVTHLFGVPAKVDELRKICKHYGIKMIEDAAEALGSKYQGCFLGGFGDYGVLSFNGNKIITTGGGGALVVGEKGYDRALHLATQANKGVFDYDHHEVGFNYRLSNVLAGVGVAQLKKLDAFVKKKRSVFAYYNEHLSQDVFELPKEPDESLCNRWLTTPLIQVEGITPLTIIQFLDEQNIESRALWRPLHLHKAYEKARFYGSGVCEKIYSEGLCLPSGTQLSDEDLAYIVDQVHHAVSS